MDLTKEGMDFIEQINQYICSQINIKYDLSDAYNKRISTDQLASIFLEGYNLKSHNYLKTNNSEDLCFDLMACLNPLEDVRRQYFYTLFSTKESIVYKGILAKIYNRYLNSYPEFNIDLILQICYANPILFEKKDQTTSSILENIHKKGICIHLLKDKASIDSTNNYNIIVPEKLISIVNRIINSEELKLALFDKIKEVNNMITVLNTDPIEYLETKSDIIDIQQIINEIEKLLTIECKEDVYNSIDDDIRLFLEDCSQENILKKVIRILLINIAAVPGIKYLYFIPLPYPNRMQIGHFVYSSSVHTSSDKLYRMRIIANTLMFPFVQANINFGYINKVNIEAIKSAISAIMARNMSHNLGSHFISNTKHYFSDLAENDEDKQRQKDYRGIRHTLQYIQERMDFIATIVSTDRFPYGPVNVKSQIFDELTPDEFGGRHEKATTNFLLDYIVFSEDISKQSNLSKSSIKLSLKLISDNGKEFGGQDIENQAAKEEFAKLNLAVPGGILGRHAIFTIIENVIRNSAKHDKENIPKEGLNVSIKIGKDYIIIFDNKKNAKKKIKDDFLIDELQKRYTDIKILSDGAIDKSNKGLKEILISALWLNNYSLADWFGEYENTSTEDKIKKLSEVLKIVTVEDNGDITDDGENLGYYIALDKYEEVYHIEGNRVKIVEGDKIYYSSISGIKADIIAANRDYEVLIDENLGQNGDASTDSNNILRLSDLYPRFFENKDEKELPQTEEMMKAIIARNTGMKLEDLEGIDIHIEPKDYNILADKSKKNHCIWHAKGEASGIKKNDILYKNHLSILKTEEIDRVIAAYEDAAYIDSISGGDFTGTITQPFFLQNDFNRLKVLESALTEFVIIDERVFKNYGHGFKPLDGDVKLESNKPILEAEKIFNEVEDLLCLEKPVDDITDSIYNRYDIVLNVSLLNGDNKEQIREDIDRKIAKKKSKAATEAEKTENNSDNISALHKMIEKRKLHIYDIDKNGNILNLKGKSIANVIKFNDMDKLCSPTFLSIHLSIIEKITKENGVAASQVMANLKKLFGNTKFVTIHSGRGNLSAELEKELKDYAFLSLSAIQAAMDDSKYFLSQLLYNNCYIGKGRLNHK